MKAADLTAMVQFAARLVALLPHPVGLDPVNNSRVAAIQFDSVAKVDFPFLSHATAAAAQTALLAITPTTPFGATSTDAAVRTLLDKVLNASAGWRSLTVPTVVVFVTDGGASSPTWAEEEIARFDLAFAGSARLHRWAIGVGAYNDTQLRLLAGGVEEQVLELAAFTEMTSDAFIATIAGKLCSPNNATTTTTTTATTAAATTTTTTSSRTTTTTSTSTTTPTTTTRSTTTSSRSSSVSSTTTTPCLDNATEPTERAKATTKAEDRR
jgi:hypothetical protein